MSSPRLLALISSRMIQITFASGTSQHFPLALALFGACLSGRGDKLGYEVGNHVLYLLHKMRVKEILPIVYGSYYVMIHPFHDSIHLSHAPLLETYRVGLETGNYELSTIAANGKNVVLSHFVLIHILADYV